MRYNGQDVWPPVPLFTGPNWMAHCRAKFNKRVTRFRGPLVPRTYAEAYAWARGRDVVRLGFATFLRRAKGTSAYEVIHQGHTAVTFGAGIGVAV